MNDVFDGRQAVPGGKESESCQGNVSKTSPHPTASRVNELWNLLAGLWASALNSQALFVRDTALSSWWMGADRATVSSSREVIWTEWLV